MKNIIVLCVVAVLAFSNSAFSQDWMKHTAGQELQKASGQFTVGVVFMGIGTALAVANLPTANRTGEPIFRTVGSVAGLAGAIVCMTSWCHIKRAGVLLDKKVTASIGPGSITLSLHL